MTTPNENALSAYCFLSALTENNNDLFNHVYLPICKRALSLYSHNGHTHGTSDDIRKIIDEQYGIDMPISIVQKLIKAVERHMSRKEKSNAAFKIFENGKTFELGKFQFQELEEKYTRSNRNAKAIQEAFEEYLKTDNPEPQVVSPFIEFIDKNRKRLSCYFKGKPEKKENGIDHTFLPHVRFLEKISESSHELYKIAESLYLGSIVASFLESGIDIEAKFSDGDVYYLDTPIILSALNLQKEEQTRPALDLLRLIKESGGTLKVLSITIEEIKGIISKAVSTYDKATPTTTVNEACLRNGNNKAWLITLNSKIGEMLNKELNIIEESIPTAVLDKFKKHPDVESLKQTRFNRGSAVHDVVAYLYIRDKRGALTPTFQKAKIWFLTSNTDLHSFNVSNNISVANNTSVSEIATPDSLTSLLWLKNPAKNNDIVKKVGLSELMATTVSEEVASRDLINDFTEQIQKIDDFSKEEYGYLISAIAHESAKKIDSIVQLAHTDQEKAKKLVFNIVERERSRRITQQEKIKQFQETIENKETEEDRLNEKIASIEAKLHEENKRLHTENIKLANQVREPKRIDFIKNKVIKWRCKIWGYLALGILVLFAGAFYVYMTNGYNMAASYNSIKSSNENIFLTISFTIVMLVFNGFLIKRVSDTYNESAVQAYKNRLTIPDNLKEIKA